MVYAKSKLKKRVVMISAALLMAVILASTGIGIAVASSSDEEGNDGDTRIVWPVIWWTDIQCQFSSDCDDSNDCTNDFCGDGLCGYETIAEGTPCGDDSDTDCDNPDTCDGDGNCLDNNEPDATPCGDQGIDCMYDDTCDGSGNCADNGPKQPGTPCTDDGNECTNDVCDETGVCYHMPDRANPPCTDDRNECTDDVCDNGVCTHPNEPEGTTCDGGTCDAEGNCERDGDGEVAGGDGDGEVGGGDGDVAVGGTVEPIEFTGQSSTSNEQLADESTNTSIALWIGLASGLAIVGSLLALRRRRAS